MSQISSIKGHFGGRAVVLDEPASLAVSHEVRVVVETATAAQVTLPSRPSRFGFAKGMFKMSDDFSDPLDEFAEYR